MQSRHPKLPTWLMFLLLSIFVSGVVSPEITQAQEPEPPTPTISTPAFGTTEEITTEAAVEPNSENMSFIMYFPQVHSTEVASNSAPIDVDPFVTEVVNLTNQQRVANGCDPVTLNTQLYQAAYGHSEDMGLNDFFSHTGSDQSNPGARIAETGYRSRTWGENIAAGYSSPTSVMSGWMGSSGHRANILNCNFTEIGVGYYYLANDTGSVNYRRYWTQVFATPR